MKTIIKKMSKLSKLSIALLLAGAIVLGGLTTFIITLKGTLANPVNPLPVPDYIIDAGSYAGLTAAGNAAKGYSYNATTRMLTFNANSAGYNYKVVKNGTAATQVLNIEFTAGYNPASVVFDGTGRPGEFRITGGITFPAGFNTDLWFIDFGVGTALTLPAGFNKNMGIYGLTALSFAMPSDYTDAVVFNGLILTGNITYPNNYAGPITIGGDFSVKGTQFPANYNGKVIIGDKGGTFTLNHILCRPGTTGLGVNTGIYLPNNITEIKMNDASGKFNIKLGASDDFKLNLAGESDIHGYIEVPQNAKLTIDSAASTPENPNSEDGKLTIESNLNNTATIGGSSIAVCGKITINGGTVNATNSDAGGAAIGGGAGFPGYVTINGGNVNAKSGTNGAAIGGGNGAAGVGFVTITGGNVTAKSEDGAAIGGGNGAVGSMGATVYYTEGAKILITGGTINATGGTITNIQLGNGSGYGAAIGSGKSGTADITIEGGNITANSVFGAGIGNGATSNAQTGGTHATSAKSRIVITGGTIRGYTLYASNIGKGCGSTYAPTLRLEPEADILMYSRVQSWDAGIQFYGNNLGKGYFVNTFSDKLIRGDLHVFDANTKQHVRTYPIDYKNSNYMSFSFSTGHDYPEQFNLYVDFYGNAPNYKYEGMRQYRHHYDHTPGQGQHGQSNGGIIYNSIPSVKEMKGYQHFDLNTDYVNVLFVCLGEGDGANEAKFWKVYEKYIDMNGKQLSGINDTITVVKDGENYTKNPIRNDIPGYQLVGYRVNTPESNLNKYNWLSINALNRDWNVYFVYEKSPYDDIFDISETVAGHPERGYTVTGTTPSYSSTFGGGVIGIPGGTVANPDRELRFNANANGKVYKIIQSGVLANPASPLTPKNGTAIYNSIVIESGVKVTLIIDSIDLIGTITLEGTADVNLLLNTDTVYLPAGNTVGSFVHKSIIVPKDAAITIDNNESNKNSELTAYAASGSSAAAIGFKNETNTNNLGNAGHITINGGKINASVSGNNVGAAIGGGVKGSGGAITVNGGTVNATVYGGGGGAAIGGGTMGSGGDILITGGTVNATNNSSSSNAGAAIGGGSSMGIGGNIRITGGTVNALVTHGYGAAIGGGWAGHGGNITISGGIVTARNETENNAGAAIGGGTNASGGNIKITAGTVTATCTNGSGAAIGGGTNGSGGDITITGGTVVATGGVYIANVEDDYIEFYAGAGIGGGDSGDPATIHIGSSANIKAYAYGMDMENYMGKPAIDVENDNDGSGFYVNAQMNKILRSEPTDINVYAHDDKTTKLDTLTLPGDYRCFAYVTGAVMRIDNLYADLGYEAMIDRVKDDVIKVFSVNTLTDYDSVNPAYATEGIGVVHIKLRSSTDVTVSKTVKGDYANKTQAFTFTVYLKDYYKTPLENEIIEYTGGVIEGMNATAPADSSVTLGAQGEATFTLLHGQTVTFKGLQASYSIRIEETEDTNYRTLHKVDGVTGEKDRDTDYIQVTSNGRKIDFENTRQIAIPAGIADDTTTATVIIAGILILAAGWVGMQVFKRRMVK